ncbi:unnamed protein product [Bemisia tabaci]|uniref:Uncharacterized protein n=1 Tax=Bemisia tabaci TaxID=7038 RepID=A0A9P0APE3_BEMTA|nr:unnamed protein product [Bemisia tabaci]
MSTSEDNFTKAVRLQLEAYQNGDITLGDSLAPTIAMPLEATAERTRAMKRHSSSATSTNGSATPAKKPGTQQKDLLKIMRAWELKMKNLKKQGKPLRACGWQDLEQLMEKEPFSTTFTRIVLEEPVKTYVCDSWLGLERELISSPATETTSTYVTRATTSTQHADATSRRSSGADLEGGWLDQALAHETSVSKDGVISQYICHQDRGTSLRLTTPGEIGYEVVKIEVYPFSEVVNEDRMNWWRSARTRALIHFNSPLDTELQRYNWYNYILSHRFCFSVEAIAVAQVYR